MASVQCKALAFKRCCTDVGVPFITNFINVCGNSCCYISRGCCLGPLVVWAQKHVCKQMIFWFPSMCGHTVHVSSLHARTIIQLLLLACPLSIMSKSAVPRSSIKAQLLPRPVSDCHSHPATCTASLWMYFVMHTNIYETFFNFFWEIVIVCQYI